MDAGGQKFCYKMNARPAWAMKSLLQNDNLQPAKQLGRVEVFVMKQDNLSSSPETSLIEGKRQLLNVHVGMETVAHTHPQVQMNKCETENGQRAQLKYETTIRSEGINESQHREQPCSQQVQQTGGPGSRAILSCRVKVSLD